MLVLNRGFLLHRGRYHENTGVYTEYNRRYHDGCEMDVGIS